MGKTLMFLNPRKRKGRRSSARRRSTRKHKMLSNPRKGRKTSSGRRRGGARRSGGGLSLGGITSSVKSLASKDMVMAGAGALVGSLATRIIWSRYGPAVSTDSAGKRTIVAGSSSLPMGESQYGYKLYSVAIPLALGIVARKFAPKVSDGLFISASVSMINAIVGSAISGEVDKLSMRPTSAYLRAGNYNVAGVGRISGRPRLAPVGNLPGFPAIFPTNSMARR